MTKAFIPFALPDIGEEEIAEVVEAMRSGWPTTGPKAHQFEKDFAFYLGTPFALSMNSGTVGLHLALESIGVRAGKEIITSPYTFTHSAEIIRYLEAAPTSVDINSGDVNTDPETTYPA